MRIISGEWRGRKLQAPEGDDTRPTADRTRETLFSMLMSRLGDFEGLRVADLFAGSGALGLEALSRGAESCLFAEMAPGAVRAIRANIAALRAQPRCDVRAGSVMALGPAKVPYDLVLLDPPYGTGAGQVAIDKLARLGWIGEGTWVALETHADEEPRVRGFDIESDRKVGKAKITLLRKIPAAPAEE
ncbi:16S rRNA (guanine(966)-N(2))-methyltransferase RsmD [Novosphingobium sp. FSY-8]|uniref:16S rRNA (Guanine(966)-N(2))-methyltransferase RsmD n=1 Tax=Novosphingobium ovatum TaxID=1908523 RepID=A0ABW9XBI6_9SPHN|nr:16S rRNA (guanine(966)-N(2))-methyltransferase RsmD [Novosphingobium ovatum]NBC35883.1 16S rRNA (guanine(966)-N(2))-methyltransferase RsmD [Novosphingobium ovatum]